MKKINPAGRSVEKGVASQTARLPRSVRRGRRTARASGPYHPFAMAGAWVGVDELANVTKLFSVIFSFQMSNI
jgi:hypothetical protein